MTLLQSTKTVLNIVIILLALLFTYAVVDDRLKLNSCLDKADSDYQTALQYLCTDIKQTENCHYLPIVLVEPIETKLTEDKMNCVKIFRD